MIFLLLAAGGFLVWYLAKHQAEKPVWAWVGLAVVAIAAVCSRGWGFGMMGGGLVGRGWSGQGGPGMMGRGWGGQGGPGMMGRGWGGQGGPGVVPYPMGRGMMSHMSGPWAWVAMDVWALIVVAVVVTAIVLIRRAIKAYNQTHSPLGVLQARLARGEISAEEFDTLRSRLQG